MSSKRVRFITLAGVLLAVLVFGVSMLMSRISVDTRLIDLPEAQASTTDDDSQSEANVSDDGLARVEVTTDTVQAVIATLKRPVSYSRMIHAVNFYSNGLASYDIEVYVLENAKIVKITGAGITKNYLIADGMLYVWEEDDNTYYEAALDATEDENKLSDMFQMILTYEDVLYVDPSNIIYAGYEQQDDEMCIAVQYTTQQLGYVTTCYISVKNGLLIAAEQTDGQDSQTVIYSMSASNFSTEIPDVAQFNLPDGTNPLRGD